MKVKQVYHYITKTQAQIQQLARERKEEGERETQLIIIACVKFYINYNV